jgi:hypothetical protein
MQIELIVPATQENLEKPGKGLCPPLGLAMVAALTLPGIDISITDENVTANLNAVGKKVNAVNEFDAIVKKIHSYGIAVHGFFSHFIGVRKIKFQSSKVKMIMQK